MTAVRARIAPDQRAAFLQLVEHPIAAAANFYELYYSVAWNRRLAATNDSRANVFATRAEAAFARDKALSAAYHAVSGGKWNGMMLQTHIGYTSWSDPKSDTMPEVKRVRGSRSQRHRASRVRPSQRDCNGPRFRGWGGRKALSSRCLRDGRRRR